MGEVPSNGSHELAEQLVLSNRLQTVHLCCQRLVTSFSHLHSPRRVANPADSKRTLSTSSRSPLTADQVKAKASLS